MSFIAIGITILGAVSGLCGLIQFLVSIKYDSNTQIFLKGLRSGAQAFLKKVGPAVKTILGFAFALFLGFSAGMTIAAITISLLSDLQNPANTLVDQVIYICSGAIGLTVTSIILSSNHQKGGKNLPVTSSKKSDQKTPDAC